MIKMLRRMLAEKADPDKYEWVLGCDIVKYLKLTSDLYLLGDIEQIKLFGLPVKVDFKEPNKMELREIKKGGEWLENDETQGKSVSICSKCGHKSIRYMYCPHCGTKMNNCDKGE